MSASFNDCALIPRSPDLSRPSHLGHSRTSSARLSGSGPSQCSPSHIELMPRTDAHATPCAENEALIMSSPGSRPARPPALSPGPNTLSKIPPFSAISDQYQSYSFNHQDVLRIQELLNQRPTPHNSGLSPNPGPQISSSSALESYALSSSSTRHVAINSHSARPRTSNQVFNNISDLASHYGIPQFLPVAPRTTPRRTESEAQSSHRTDSLSSPDFANICSNYLTMLSQNPGDDGASDVPLVGVAPESASPEVTDETLRSLMDVLNATPELQTSNDLNEYLTSPLIDSPLDDDLLTTPAVGSDMHADVLTSPLMGDFGNDSFGEFSPLFEDFGDVLFRPPKPPQHEPYLSPHPPNFDGMYRLESPNTPLIDSPGVSPFPGNTVSLPSGQRKSTATGTRKNITPESLVPIDAPTQTRKYVIPSATSRKELPATWRRKRLRTAEPGDEEDQLVEQPTPTLSEQEQIEAKRRQNTIAARRSRKRKLEYQRELEESLEQHKRESEMWKQRAMTYLALLRSHHIDCPEFPDS